MLYFYFQLDFFPFILIRIYEVDYSMETKKGKNQWKKKTISSEPKSGDKDVDVEAEIVVVVEDVEFVLNVKNEPNEKKHAEKRNKRMKRCARVWRCKRLRENERSGKRTEKMRA